MRNIDYKRALRHLYRPSPKSVDVVEVPEMNFLMIDGQGDPNTCQAFSDAVEALYALSYTLKFMIKRGDMQTDYGVMPLEGLWWADDMAQFAMENKINWKWTLLIMQPEFVTQALVSTAHEQVQAKKNPVALPRVRFEPFHEGIAAQTMHIGPFSEEGPTIDRIHDFIRQRGYLRVGKHHEIYLSDIRKAAPQNWKTVIRQPIEKSYPMETT